MFFLLLSSLLSFSSSLFLKFISLFISSSSPPPSASIAVRFIITGLLLCNSITHCSHLEEICNFPGPWHNMKGKWWFFFPPSYVHTMIEKTSIPSTLSLSFSTQKTQSVLFIFLFFSSCGTAGWVSIWCISLFPFVVDVFGAIVVVFCGIFSFCCCCSPHHHYVSDFWICRFFFEKIHLISGYAGLFEKSLRIWVVLGFEGHLRGVVRIVCVWEDWWE